MRLLGSLGLVLLGLAPVSAGAPRGTSERDSWRAILSSVHVEGSVTVVPAGATASGNYERLAESGRFVVLQGDSKAAEALGVRATNKRVTVRSVVELRARALPVVWEEAVELPVFELGKEWTVFTRERWSEAPLVAGRKIGAGGVLWVAMSPGVRGYERFPYILQALADLGLEPPVVSRRLWAFFDSSYRSRVDVEYFATKWRQTGIAALHVAAWHYWEPDAERDAFLRKLVEACHRNGVLVYAWLELPHVSERFWMEHPEWREKTALLQDAHLDWRKLMNLQNADCRRAVSQGLRGLLDRFDWDGANLGELYFESLEGFANKARFTPMNDDVRRDYRSRFGVDPAEIKESDKTEVRQFLDYRAELTRQLQGQWIGEMEEIRKTKPDFDLVLTHIDDRYDGRMRDLLGADAVAALGLLDKHSFTFLIEDPAT
ncbi:MAG TPA: hypothetical protein VE621_22125, partial [Bryobacteraceae bacterium]|nr:hypothetical protein [Bryobacteraceae bacterium]